MYTLRLAKQQPEYATYRERYKVDLPLQMAECELNYARLKRLVANHIIHVNDELRFMVTRGRHEWLHTLRVIECSRYTTTMQFTQSLVSADTSWLSPPQLTVRMYHDAKLAEVLAWEGHKRLRPRYEYPNQSMYYADEKLQVNQFLGELLTRALAEGHHLENSVTFKSA